MKETIEIKDLAQKMYELFECRYVAISFGGYDIDDRIFIFVSIHDFTPPEYVMNPIHGQYSWEGSCEERPIFSLPLIDSSGEYSTNGEIDFSKCLFDFGEEKENED